MMIRRENGIFNNLKEYFLKNLLSASPNQSMIIAFPSSVEFHEWCEKLSSLLAPRSPQLHHLQAPYTPQLVSKVEKKTESNSERELFFSPEMYFFSKLNEQKILT